jgi:hypothetical protein
MSETKHSPEPWQFDEWDHVKDARGEIVVLSGFALSAGYREFRSPEKTDRRIVACVNACAGLSTEALEAGALGKALDVLSAAAQPPGTHTVKGLRGLAAGALRALGRLK